MNNNADNVDTGSTSLTARMMPTSLTVSVFTRHSARCPKCGDPKWKDCNCRKSLYIYDNGKVIYLSTKTRSWEAAERIAQIERDARDPLKRRSADNEMPVTENLLSGLTAEMRYLGACVIAAVRIASERPVHIGSTRGRRIVQESLTMANEVFDFHAGIHRLLLRDFLQSSTREGTGER